MAIPPSRTEILDFIEKNSYMLDYPEARKRLLREYFFQDLKDIEQTECFDIEATNVKINRLAKVVGGILTQLP